MVSPVKPSDMPLAKDRIFPDFVMTPSQKKKLNQYLKRLSRDEQVTLLVGMLAMRPELVDSRELRPYLSQIAKELKRFSARNG